MSSSSRSNVLSELLSQRESFLQESSSFNRHLSITRFCFISLIFYPLSVFYSYLVERLKAMPDKFYLIWPEPELVNVCFWYIPKRLRGLPHTKEWEEELGRVSISRIFSPDLRFLQKLFLVILQTLKLRVFQLQRLQEPNTIKQKDHLLEKPLF